MRRRRRHSPMIQANVTRKLSQELLKFYNDGVLQAVTCTYLFSTDAYFVVARLETECNRLAICAQTCLR